jgi:hypothetical protein
MVLFFIYLYQNTEKKNKNIFNNYKNFLMVKLV